MFLKTSIHPDAFLLAENLPLTPDHQHWGLLPKMCNKHHHFSATSIYMEHHKSLCEK